MAEETQNDMTHTAVADEAPTEEVSVEETIIDATAVEQDAPDVDELELRLADLQAAMDQLQAGDLDGAEAAVVALEEKLAAEHGGRS